jgi:hypothetical protein
MNKLLITSMSLSLVVLFTSNNNFTNANALTPPASYDLAYTFIDNPSPAPDYFALIAPFYEKNGLEMPYTRTSDGAFFNYTRIFDNALSDRIPLGLSITQTFNRSNTSWSGIAGGYYPSSSTIGSDNTVGSLLRKVDLTFNNQTNKDYLLYLDLTGTPLGSFTQFTIINGNTLRDGFGTDSLSYSNNLNILYIPAFSTLNWYYSGTSAQRMLSAWYLKDLGVSASYNEGYLDGDADGFEDGFDLGYEDGFEDGFDDGLEALENSTSGLFDILGNVFGAVSTIFAIYILPGINIGMFVFIPLIFTLLLFILKILRGGA